MDYTFNFNTTPSAWETTVGPVTYDSTNGATFTISKQGDSPTIRSTFYIFFGRVEIWMKAAAGTGIISSVMFLSDDLDEIDWEFMGGNHTHAETNYFGKGVEDYHNAIYYPVTGGIIDDFHNYTTHWTKDALDFYIDGQLVRTLLPKDANNTLYYPQTPMRISMGIWAGGDPTLAEGIRQWAGGDTDYSQGPFNMYVRSAQVTDFSQGKEYTYGNMSGSYESIEITA
jgi:beta-glucanase (GH16 family)